MFVRSWGIFPLFSASWRPCAVCAPSVISITLTRCFLGTGRLGGWRISLLISRELCARIVQCWLTLHPWAGPHCLLVNWAAGQHVCLVWLCSSHKSYADVCITPPWFGSFLTRYVEWVVMLLSFSGLGNNSNAPRQIRCSYLLLCSGPSSVSFTWVRPLTFKSSLWITDDSRAHLTDEETGTEGLQNLPKVTCWWEVDVGSELSPGLQSPCC